MSKNCPVSAALTKDDLTTLQDLHKDYAPASDK